MANPDVESLRQRLAWLDTETCPCKHARKPIGLLYGISMGDGWVRLTTEPDCPHHGVQTPIRRAVR